MFTTTISVLYNTSAVNRFDVPKYQAGDILAAGGHLAMNFGGHAVVKSVLAEAVAVFNAAEDGTPVPGFHVHLHRPVAHRQIAAGDVLDFGTLGRWAIADDGFTEISAPRRRRHSRCTVGRALRADNMIGGSADVAIQH